MTTSSLKTFLIVLSGANAAAYAKKKKNKKITKNLMAIKKKLKKKTIANRHDQNVIPKHVFFCNVKIRY
jgi:hypothetical protein